MQKMILAASLALALASCGGGNSGTPAPGNETGTALKSLSGKVYVPSTGTQPVKALPWSAGQKTVELEVITSHEPMTTKVISTGTISAAGDLNISLPDTGIPSLPVTDYVAQPVTTPMPTGYSHECTGGIKPENPQARVLGGTLNVGSTTLSALKDSVSLDNLFPDKKLTLASLLYTDGATSLTGSTTCRTSYQGNVISTTKITMNAQLKKGWNILYIEATISDDAKTTDMAVTTTGSTPTRWLTLETP